MGEAYFYHLTRQPVEAALPILLERARGAGWNVVVRGTRTERMAWLDERLWLGEAEGFLPHGLAGGPHDEAQPILLATGSELPANNAECLMCIDGAAADADEVKAHERVCILFDGNDTGAVQTARDQWRALTGAGCIAKYWSEEGGRWEMKAESGASVDT